jgi:hypothetical protein
MVAQPMTPSPASTSQPVSFPREQVPAALVTVFQQLSWADRAAWSALDPHADWQADCCAEVGVWGSQKRVKLPGTIQSPQLNPGNVC